MPETPEIAPPRKGPDRKGPDRKGPGRRGRKGEWYVVIQMALLALIAIGPSGSRDVTPWMGLRVSGILLLGLGVLFLLAGTRALGRNLTPLPQPKNESELVTTGAYSWVRHPIYTGLILSGLGWAIFRAGPLPLGFTAALFILLDRKAKLEESYLVGKFDGYEGYRARVKKLIPWIY